MTSLLAGWGRRAADLIQIRRAYRASCFDLEMTVEGDADGWTARVHSQGASAPLHSVRRRSLEAAKLAAAEFAVFRMTGAMAAETVATMAEHLPWAEGR